MTYLGDPPCVDLFPFKRTDMPKHNLNMIATIRRKEIDYNVLIAPVLLPADLQRNAESTSA